MLRSAAPSPEWTWPATTAPRVDLYRLRKATLYADIIEAGNISPEAVDRFTTGQWNALALIAKGKPPSPETCAVIRQLLRQRANWRERVAQERRGSYMPPNEEKHIIGYGLRWTVVLPLGRDPATGKQIYHRKSLRGPKTNARAYRDWYAGLIAAAARARDSATWSAAEPPKETVSQAELEELGDLELKAAQFKEKLLARVHAGGKVQPGQLGLS